MKKLLLLGFAILSILPHQGRATAVESVPMEQLVKQAEIIFVGKVTAIQSAWEGQGQDRCIRSSVTLEVQKVLKGNPSSPYVLRLLGGTVGDQTLEIVGTPKFKIGESNLLFVENNGTQFFPLVGIMQGFYKLEFDAASGEEIVLNHQGKMLHSAAEIDNATVGMADKAIRSGALTALRRSELEKRIQSSLTAQGNK